MKKRAIQVVLFVFLLIVFVWGVVELFEIRFARGDVYPPYSTLRVDPLGSMVLFDSLAALPGLEVSRNERPLDRFVSERRTTLLYLGTRNLFWSEKTIDALEKFITAGGRLVITFYPQETETSLVEKETKDQSPTPSPSPQATPTPTEKFFDTRRVGERWNFKLRANAKLIDSAAITSDSEAIDAQLSWHSALYFGDSETAWKTIYAALGFPVVVERRMGEGSIVLAADSYFLSNEAMRRDRHPAFLTWVMGPHRRIVFDETHLGVREDPGIGSLIRRYRLGGLIAGLFILALLAIWKNATPLIPLDSIRPTTDEVVSGKDSFTGLVNLLRRNIAPRDLLRVCVEEWAKFLPHKGEVWQRKAARAFGLLESGADRDPIQKYQEINLEVNETKWKRRN
jgi:hypothetical protein